MTKEELTKSLREMDSYELQEYMVCYHLAFAIDLLVNRYRDKLEMASVKKVLSLLTIDERNCLIDEIVRDSRKEVSHA